MAVSDSTVVLTVTVDAAAKFFVSGGESQAQDSDSGSLLKLTTGVTYRFDQADASNATATTAHRLRRSSR